MFSAHEIDSFQGEFILVGIVGDFRHLTGFGERACHDFTPAAVVQQFIRTVDMPAEGQVDDTVIQQFSRPRCSVKTAPEIQQGTSGQQREMSRTDDRPRIQSGGFLQQILPRGWFHITAGQHRIERPGAVDDDQPEQGKIQRERITCQRVFPAGHFQREAFQRAPAGAVRDIGVMIARGVDERDLAFQQGTEHAECAGKFAGLSAAGGVPGEEDQIGRIGEYVFDRRRKTGDIVFPAADQIAVHQSDQAFVQPGMPVFEGARLVGIGKMDDAYFHAE